MLFSYGDYPFLGGDAYGALASDANGYLYGASDTSSPAPGSLYRVSPSGGLAVLHSFSSDNGGCYNANGALAIDRLGNLYGTTLSGGTTGAGCVYEYTAAGVFSILYSFPIASNAVRANGGLVLDAAGTLYGTTLCGGAFGQGSVYALKAGVETTLYSFTGGNDGGEPEDGLTLDASGNLYGTAQFGLNKEGVVYQVTR